MGEEILLATEGCGLWQARQVGRSQPRLRIAVAVVGFVSVNVFVAIDVGVAVSVAVFAAIPLAIARAEFDFKGDR